MPTPDVKLKHEDTEISVPDYVQGHLLWEAMKDFRRNYEALTQLCWQLSYEHGGPDTRAADQAASRQGADGRALSMRDFTDNALRKVALMHHALERGKVMCEGEVYDTLIDERLLAPKEVNGRREIVVDDGHAGPTTTITGYLTRITVQLAKREPDQCDGQPYVNVNTEGAVERLHSESGDPILSVHLNDADLYDDEGQGDRIKTAVPRAVGYVDALEIAADRIEEPGMNPEYERGMVNLLADLYPIKEMDTGARMETIESDLRKRLGKRLP